MLAFLDSCKKRFAPFLFPSGFSDILGITKSMLLFHCSQNPFDCFFSQFINLFVSQCMTNVFCHFHVFFSNMVQDYFYMVFVFCAFVYEDLENQYIILRSAGIFCIYSGSWCDKIISNFLGISNNHKPHHIYIHIYGENRP